MDREERFDSIHSQNWFPGDNKLGTLNKLLRAFVYILIAIYAISGLSTTLLRVYQYSDYFVFYKYDIDSNYVVDKKFRFFPILLL